MKEKILLIEDDDGSRLGIVRSLSQKGYAVSVASNLANAEDDVLARRFDAVILGINRPGTAGPEFITGIRAYGRYLPIIVVTGSAEIGIAVDAVRSGADNVIAKPIDFAALAASLATLLEECSPETTPGAAGPDRKEEEDFFGTGPAADSFFALAAGAAADHAPVLIRGETGTGKGMLARWLHRNGNRSGLPFAALNCSGLRGELLEAELFGAGLGGGGTFRSTPGLLEQTGGGTLFLDEIGDMGLTVQAGLLALLQDRSPQAVRSGEPGAGLRLICSSNQQLEMLVRAGSFLPELLARIGATVLRIPPLRERPAEFPAVVRHLLDGLRGPDTQITGQALQVLQRYHWPGNLRELRNALEQGLLLSHGAPLCPEHFNWLKPPPRTREGRPPLTMSEVKEEHIAALLVAGGDLNEVATTPGISRATRYRRLKGLRSKQI